MDALLLHAHARGLLARGIVALPLPVLRALVGRPPEVARDLEPEAWLLARMATFTERLTGGRAPSVDTARRVADAETHFLSVRPRAPVRSEDRTAGGVPVR
ncbi:MAG: hypothetical protein ACR2NB_00680, partial [Solirubrobacteraceae bacterium]